MAISDEYKNIDDSFKTGFETRSNKELVHIHKTTDNEYGRQDISLEMNRRLIDEIQEFNKKSSKHTKWIIWLTMILGLLALIQIFILLK